MKISKKQAEILLGLLSYDEIRARGDGYYFEGQGKLADGRALIGLIRREMLSDTRTQLMPSVGKICTLVFYDEDVTKKGREAFLKYVESLPSWDQKEWLQKAKALEEREK